MSRWQFCLAQYAALKPYLSLMLGSRPGRVSCRFELTFGDQQLAHVGQPFFGGDVQGREPILVLLGQVDARVGQEHFHHVNHVLFDCLVHGGVPTDLFVVLDVGVGLDVEQRLNEGGVLGFDCEVEWGLAVNILRIFVDLLFLEQRNGIVDVVMRYAVEQNVSSNFLDFGQHLIKLNS